MRKFLPLLMVIFWACFLISSARAWSTSYNVSGNFTLTGFSDGNYSLFPLPVPPGGTNGPDTFTLVDISGLTLPNPDPGLYEWYLDLEYLYLDLTSNLSGNELEIGPYSNIPLGEWEAPLSASGSTTLPDIDIPERSVTIGGYTVTLGGFTLSGVTFSWAFYEDGEGTDLAEPGDPILSAELTFSGGNLNVLNSQLAALEFYWEYYQGAPPFNLNEIDGSFEASFTIRANPLGGSGGGSGSGGSGGAGAPVPEPATGLLLAAALPFVYRLKQKYLKK